MVELGKEMQDETQNPPAKAPQTNAESATSPLSPPHKEGLGEAVDSSNTPADLVPKPTIEKSSPTTPDKEPISDLSLNPSPSPGEGKEIAQPAVQTASLEFRQKVREGQIRKLEKRLKRVWELAKAKGQVTNDEIQKALKISDATASRYTKELVRRGLLKKSGKTKSASYEAV